MIKIYKIFLFGLIVAVGVSCTDLELEPKSSTTNAIVFDDPSSYKSFLARIYSGLAVTGQQGPAGDGDIQGIDEGFSSYWRQYWGAQVLSTDEAVIGWGDEGLPDFHNHNWTAGNQFVAALYNRIFFQIGMANEFLRETTEGKLAERGTNEQLKAEINEFRAEARFLRALSYWHAIDLYGDIPFFTEEDALGKVSPEQETRANVFSFIESELKAIETQMSTPGDGEYGRADQAAAWALLAKLYLNASVYTGTDRSTDCITYCKKIIGAGYTLDENYKLAHGADNHTSEEIIFSINFDGANTRTWGGMTFITHASVGGDMDPAEYGIDGGWWGLRATSSLVDLFPDVTGEMDSRAIFYTEGHTKEIDNIFNFFDGYAAPKFTNIASDGSAGSNETVPDTDFPVFRLSDVYLMYAESVLRSGTGGDRATAVSYINMLKERAYGDNSGNITDGQLTLEFVKDERARELYWEAHRRTDLIRFGEFTDKGIWPWKGGVKEGKVTESFRNVYPIPSSELLANTKLDQNDGY
ncbi:MAG: RagB/SusD family nutrient uptake outer membrane protein [Flammeovirgaceae bacterium]|nr:RagB/SusD family nutrient uptake outer membrane protein [Flammeovirgaceae bacterium]